MKEIIIDNKFIKGLNKELDNAEFDVLGVKVKKEKSQKEKDNDKVVAETIYLFKDINEGIQKLYGNKTERKWSLHLHNKYGGEKVRAMIAFVPTYNKGLKPTKTGKVYGKIIKPSQLVEHLQDFIEAKRKLDRQLEYEIKKAEIEKKEKEDFKEIEKERDVYTQEQKEEMLKKRREHVLKLINGF